VKGSRTILAEKSKLIDITKVEGLSLAPNPVSNQPHPAAPEHYDERGSFLSCLDTEPRSEFILTGDDGRFAIDRVAAATYAEMLTSVG
jgi:hypothetical protein